VRVDARYIRSLQGERRSDILRKIAAWESHLEPNARIGCDGGVCHYTRLWCSTPTTAAQSMNRSSNDPARCSAAVGC